MNYRTMSGTHHLDDVVAMMTELYREDHAASGAVDHANFARTVKSLRDHPERGRVVLFEDQGSLHGYALLIPYWSNEFGGTILFIDELFVIQASRNRGIGRGFIHMIEQTRPFHATAIFLEVSVSNIRARKLYESLGFEQRSNATLVRRLAPHRTDPSA